MVAALKNKMRIIWITLALIKKRTAINNVVVIQYKICC